MDQLQTPLLGETERCVLAIHEPEVLIDVYWVNGVPTCEFCGRALAEIRRSQPKTEAS